MSNIEGIRTRNVEELERAPRRPMSVEDLRAAEQQAIFELRAKIAEALTKEEPK